MPINARSPEIGRAGTRGVRYCHSGTDVNGIPHWASASAAENIQKRVA